MFEAVALSILLVCAGYIAGRVTGSKYTNLTNTIDFRPGDDVGLPKVDTEEGDEWKRA